MTGAYTYDAFGAVRSHTGASTQWSYTGEQNDPNGLKYLRARYYDPAIGRFLSRDPFSGFVRSPQTLNRYPYSVNEPVNLADPWGLCGFRSFGDFGDCFKPQNIGGGFQRAGRWVTEHPTMVADVVSILGNLGPPLLLAGLASGNPLLIGGGIVLTGGNLAAFIYSSSENRNATAQGCISRGEQVGRQIPLGAGFYPNPVFSTAADIFTLSLDVRAHFQGACPTAQPFKE